MENTSSSGNKRYRGGSDVYYGDPKRLRQTDLIYILDDDEDDFNFINKVRDPEACDITAIMNSLEEEMGLLSPPPPLLTQQPDLCYLLEASDDELGLPPATSTTSSLSSEQYCIDVVVHNITADAPASGFDQIWGFNNDNLSCSFGYELAIAPDVALSFDDDDDAILQELFGQQQQQDFSDLIWWQSQFLPTTIL